MLDGVDGLDAVGRAQVRAQVVDRRLPVDALWPGSAAAARAVWASADMFQKPATSDERHDEQDAPRRDRRREQGERDRRELEPLDIRAEVARHHERDEQRGEEHREEPEEAARACHARGHRHAEHAEEDARHEIGEAEREVPLPGEQPPQDELERDSGAAITATVARARGGRSSAPPASTSTSSRNASGLASSVRKSRIAKLPRRPCWSALIESSANAMPSANGNAAERTMPGQRTAKARLEKRAARPPLAARRRA